MYIKIAVLILLIAIIGFFACKLHNNKRIEYYKDKQLHFIHIPKNAGTTIENLAKENNILWGRFDKEYNNEGKIILDDTYSSKLKLYNFVILLDGGAIYPTAFFFVSFILVQ